MRIANLLRSKTSIALLLLVTTQGAMCESMIDPVVPESVETTVIDDENDPLWLSLESEFSEGQLFGTKRADGTIDKVERMVLTSLRNGRTHTIDLDNEERVAAWGDDQGNLVFFTYTDSELQYDFMDANGETGSFSVPLSDLPELPSKTRLADKKQGDLAAQTLVTPGTAAIVSTVTRNRSIVTNAIVTARVDYYTPQLGSFFFSDGPYENKYFSAFVHRREPFTARFEACEAQSANLNRKLELTTASMFFVATGCKLLAGPTPGQLVCIMMDSGAIIIAELGFVLGSLVTEFPEYFCADKIIPADPDVATIVVNATIPGSISQTSQRTINLHELGDPRILEFSFAFETPAGDCAPNSSFDVLLFDNGPLDVPDHLLCVRGEPENPIFDWPFEVPNPFEIVVRDVTNSEIVWQIRVQNTSDDVISPPLGYGVIPSGVSISETTPPKPIVRGNVYSLELLNFENPDIRFRPN